MNMDIKIIEKPDWVSWDEIHEVLYQAHASNREHGIIMRKPSLPGSEIAKEIGEDGKMFVAMDGKRVVGTAAIVVRQKSYWCGTPQEKYACVYFASVLPEYSGQGIFKRLDLKREEEALVMGINKLLGDTHERNYHRLEILKKTGYKFVDYMVCKDHYNVVCVKWLDGCPYSGWYIKWQFLIRKWYKKLRYKPGRIKRFGI